MIIIPWAPENYDETIHLEVRDEFRPLDGLQTYQIRQNSVEYISFLSYVFPLLAKIIQKSNQFVKKIDGNSNTRFENW